MVTRVFEPTLFMVLVSYQRVIMVLRVLELNFIALRLLFFRAPLVIVWTRTPGLRGRKAPYAHLAEALSPHKGRRPLLVHQAKDVTLGDIKTKEELIRFVREMKREASVPRPTIEQIAGGFLQGLLIEFGPVWVKLGTIISMRSGVPEFIRESFRSFHDNVPPPLSGDEIMKRVRREMKEFGRPFEDIFEWVDPNPIACASLAQVHRAKLSTGDMVALKIQRPGVAPRIKMDTQIITTFIVPFVWMIFRGLRKWEPKNFGESFCETTSLELDFYMESCYQQELAHRCKEDHFYSKTVKIPKVYSQLCTKKLLVQELIEGYHSIDGIFDMGDDKLWDLLSTKFDEYPQDYSVHLFRTMCSLWGDMVLNWGVINADPHMGNVYFMEPQDGYGWRVFVCDFGLYFEAAQHMKQWLLEWIRAVMWLRSSEEFMRVSLRYIEPYKRLKDVDKDFPRIVRSRYSAKVEDRMMDFYFTPDSEAHAVEPREFMRKQWIQRPGDEQMPFVMPVRPPTGSTNTEELMQMVQKFSIGFHAESILTNQHWAIFKSVMYIEALGSALFKDVSWNDIFGHALRERMKEDMISQLKTKDSDNIREFLNDTMDVLQRPMQIWKIGRPRVP